MMASMKTDAAPEEVASNPYGYGLCIRLNDDQCEALGITAPLPAGSKVTLSALAFVKEAVQSVEDDKDDSGTDVRMELQITDLEVTPARGQIDAKAMYPNSNMS